MRRLVCCLTIGYCFALTCGLTLWIWSHYRIIGIISDEPCQVVSSKVVSHRFLLIERGVVVIGDQKWYDLSGVKTDNDQKVISFSNDPVSEEQTLIPASFTYENSPIWNRLGFGFLSTGSLSRDSSYGLIEWFIPAWAIFFILLFPAFILFIRYYFIKNRQKRGLCIKCGYNLCCSGDRCPECGTVRASGPDRINARAPAKEG